MQVQGGLVTKNVTTCRRRVVDTVDPIQPKRERQGGVCETMGFNQLARVLLGFLRPHGRLDNKWS